MTLIAPPPFAFDPPLPSLPEDATAHAQQLRTKGIAALQEERYEAARACFITLGKLKDVKGAGYLSKVGIAHVWSRQRQFSKALQVSKEALGLGDDRFVLLYIGVTLHQMERFAEALDVFDKVKGKWPDDPDVWVYRIPPLVSLEKAQAALESAEWAFPLRHNSSDRGQTLYICAALVSVGFGLSALKRRWLPDLEAATKAFIKWRARARRDKQTAVFKQTVDGYTNALQGDERLIFDDFMLSVKLGSIKDPFKRWDAIAEEINKVWPSDLSAVEAIRRQRE